MNIREASNRWNVRENTVFDYINKGYIYGISVKNNKIIIPDIPKPYVKRKPKTVKGQDNYIISALNNGCYVNADIMDLSPDKFKERLLALIKSKRIYPRKGSSVDYSSSLDFVILNTTKVDFNINNLIGIQIETNFESQIGLLNLDVL